MLESTPIHDQRSFRQIFWQTWRDLVFLHWEVDPQVLSSLLPPQLEPDLFQGKAYIGLVPFRMTDIRSVWLPPIPGTSHTLETNVRTYVKRRCLEHEPVPAVWFFSLEAQSALAVTIARIKYGLPYFKASMKFETSSLPNGTQVFVASSSRCWPGPVPANSLVEAIFPVSTPYKSAVVGTLEYFLIERYALFAKKGGKLTYARVQHSPYQFRHGHARKLDPGLIQAAGIQTCTGTPSPLVHHAKDVVVKIGAPSAV